MAILVERRAAIPFWWGLVSAGGMVLGAFGPWVTALGISVSGTGGSNDGWLVFAAAAVAVIALVTYRRNAGRGKAVWCLLAGVGGTVVTVYDRNNVSSAINQGGSFAQGLVQVGWGLNLAMVASISLGISALFLLGASGSIATSVVEKPGEQPTLRGTPTRPEIPMYRECPHCKEQMRRDAKVCPHCRLESEAWTLNDGAWWIWREDAWQRWDESAGTWIAASSRWDDTRRMWVARTPPS